MQLFAHGFDYQSESVEIKIAPCRGCAAALKAGCKQWLMVLMIELDETQLPDDEAAEFMVRQQAEQIREAEDYSKLQAKMRSFRFSGGML